MTEYFDYEKLKKLILNYSGNDNPGIFIEYKGKCLKFKTYIENGDIIFNIKEEKYD